MPNCADTFEVELQILGRECKDLQHSMFMFWKLKFTVCSWLNKIPHGYRGIETNCWIFETRSCFSMGFHAQVLVGW